ncbi:MAG: hypothetical protein ACXVHX_12510 [Solirubrobacteraceae bacterium]
MRVETREVLAGNGTMEAALAEGWSEIWATFVDVDADTARHPSTGPEREELDSVDSLEVRARRIRNLYRDGMKYEDPVAGRMMRR